MAEADGLAADCMARNGFDYAGPQREVRDIDLAPGLEGPARFAKIGSGIVEFELWMLDQGPEAFGVVDEDSSGEEKAPSESLDDAAFQEARHKSVSIDGESVPGGCVRWAEREYLRLHPEHGMRLELLDAYGSHMRAVDYDIGMKEANEAWGACMASEGFPDYHRIGDHMKDIDRRVEAIFAGGRDQSGVRRELEELKQFDIEVTMAAATCWWDIADRRDEILEEYHRSFADIHREELDELVAAE